MVLQWKPVCLTWWTEVGRSSAYPFQRLVLPLRRSAFSMLCLWDEYLGMLFWRFRKWRFRFVGWILDRKHSVELVWWSEFYWLFSWLKLVKIVFWLCWHHYQVWNGTKSAIASFCNHVIIMQLYGASARETRRRASLHYNSVNHQNCLPDSVAIQVYTPSCCLA